MQKIIPEAVEKIDRGFLKLNQDLILWAMLNGLKEEHRQKNAEIGQLKAENAAKDAELKLLKNFLCDKFSDAPMCGR